MSKDVKQLLVMLSLNIAVLGALWLGVTLSSTDLNLRDSCYKQGVESLPQGIDQTFLHTQSTFSKCLTQAK